jgi:KipI family sensor histidine kinase inhibitor
VAVRRAGERALLIDAGSAAGAHRLARAARRHLADEAEDVVPGARSVLVILARPDRLPDVVAAAPGWAVEPGEEIVGRTVEVPVVYDGPDLADVAEISGLTAAELIEAHTGAEHIVDFLGFAPGFAYLSGSPLDVPRLAAPRAAVPAGSVAVAGRQSAVYPSASPGGWRLIGRTDLAVWDVRREPPALFEPGDRVRFVRVG